MANPHVACAFGGRDLDELYVTTARLGLKADELTKQPLAGDLFRVRLNIQGQEEPLIRIGRREEAVPVPLAPWS